MLTVKIMLKNCFCMTKVLSKPYPFDLYGPGVGTVTFSCVGTTRPPCVCMRAHTHTHTHILVKTVNTRFRWASLFGTMNMLSCIIAMSLSMSPCNSNESGILCLVPHYPYECSLF